MFSHSGRLNKIKNTLGGVFIYASIVKIFVSIKASHGESLTFKSASDQAFWAASGPKETKMKIIVMSDSLY